MATKTITIREEAYERLKAIKGDRSFSEVIIDVTEDRKPDLMESFGAWEGEKGEKAKERIEKFRKEFDRDFDEKVES